MRKREFVLVLLVVTLISWAQFEFPSEPESWSLRASYFEPRLGRNLWFDELNLLGGHFLCNGHPLLSSKNRGWHQKGVYADGEDMVLEIDVVYRSGDCDSGYPWTPPHLGNAEHLCTLFVGDEAIAETVMKSNVSPSEYFTPLADTKTCRKIHFRLSGLTREQKARLTRAVEATPYPERYDNEFDPRARTYKGKKLPQS